MANYVSLVQITMKLSIRTIAVLLGAIVGVHCLPTTPPETISETSTNPIHPLAKRQDWCSAPNYNNEYGGGDTSDGSPLVEDCLTMLKNIADGGDWTTEQPGFRTLTRYGTCAFGVQEHTPIILDFSVGNNDIIQVVRESIDKFAKDGRVGASGYWLCSSKMSTHNYREAYWSLFHNDQ